MKPQRIYLIGPMGAGKSTIGRQLATELKLDFVDTDAEIERRCGADIPWIFDVEGEQGFRLRETQVLEELSTQSKCVIATGGGIVTQDRNRQILQGSGFVVYLYTTIEQQVERTARDRKRPLLQVEEPREVIEALMLEREPMYRDLADLIVSTDRRTAKKVAVEIVTAIDAS
ncbi:MAG: shikimate kinase AroK [Pseudomonadota bacterium]